MSYYESQADKLNYLNLRTTSQLKEEPHFHNALEAVIVLEGAIEVTVNAVKKRLVKGQGCLINGLDVHYYGNIGEFKAVVLVAGDIYYKGLEAIDDFNAINTFFTVDDETAFFAEDFANNWKEQSTLERLSNVAMLFAKISVNGESIYESVRKNEFIIELFKYIHANYKKSITIESIAKEFGYSRGYVSTLFCDYAGERFNTYINRLRVRSAKADLDKKTGSNVLEIAFSNGFDSANTFYRAYKKEYGVHPVRK